MARQLRQCRPAELLLAAACVMHACAFATAAKVTCYGAGGDSGFDNVNKTMTCDKTCVTEATYNKESGDISKTMLMCRGDKCDQNDPVVVAGAGGQKCVAMDKYTAYRTREWTIKCCCNTDKCVKEAIGKPDATACAGYRQPASDCYKWGKAPCLAAVAAFDYLANEGNLTEQPFCNRSALCDKLGGDEACGIYPTVLLQKPDSKQTPDQLLAMVDEAAHKVAMEMAKSPARIGSIVAYLGGVFGRPAHVTFAHACCCKGHKCNEQLNVTDKPMHKCYKGETSGKALNAALKEEVCPRADDLCYSATIAPSGHHAELMAKLKAAGESPPGSAMRRSAHSCAPPAMCKFLVGKADGIGCAKSTVFGQTSVCCCKGSLCNELRSEGGGGGNGSTTLEANAAAVAIGFGPPLLYAPAALLLAAANGHPL